MLPHLDEQFVGLQPKHCRMGFEATFDVAGDADLQRLLGPHVGRGRQRVGKTVARALSICRSHNVRYRMRACSGQAATALAIGPWALYASRMIWSVIIGALLGYKLGGLPGMLLGGFIGYWVNDRLFGRPRPVRQPQNRTRSARAAAAAAEAMRRHIERQQIYTTSVINLAAKMAKIDGAVTRDEIDAFKAAFSISPDQSAAIAALYDEAKRDPSDYEAHARRLARSYGDTPQVLIDVLDALTAIALADGTMHPAEQAFLQRIAEIFGLVGRRFASQKNESGDGDAYAVLGVAHGATMPEIKAAWRKLTREHHPDTLMAKGMPQEYIDLATKKMATINAAYDRICAERGAS
jgi:DnaJ like chaperone protein